tara:strand:- start:9173 stop:9670 length:498 start_codon:yes stop_codon:yes gene_type:complete
LLNLHAKRLEGKVFDSIDSLPIYNWWQIHKAHDFTWLYSIKRRKVGKYTRTALQTKWGVVYDGYIARFGLSEDYLKLIEKKKEIAALKVERMETGSKALNTFIKIAELELNEMQKGDGREEVDFYESKSHVEKQLGFALDPMKISVSEFYSHIKVLKQSTKQQKG